METRIILLFMTLVLSHVRADGPAYHASVPKPTLSNVPYGPHERQVLDFWKAPSASADKPAPLVFYIHGGSWKTGSKEIINGCVDVNALLKAGISVAAINYRYVSQAEEAGVLPPVKVPLEDAARALQVVRSKANEWHINKERIGATGASAGGCSSLWLAYHDDMADPDSDDPVARESTRLFCAGVRVPQTSLDPQQMKEWVPDSGYGGHAFGKRNFAEFLRSREELLPWIRAYSPYAHVSADDPPVSLYYDKNLEGNLGAHSPQFGFHLQKRCRELGLFCEVLYDRAPGYTQNEATFYLIKTLTAPHTLWKSGEGGYHTYRIPALIKTTKGTLLAFAEGRKDSSADHGDIDIVIKRSEDNGKTWSTLQVIQDDGKYLCGNPCPLVDAETGRIFLLSNGSQHSEGSILRGKGSREIYISHSDDDGKTWSERRNISAMVKKPDWRWYATGPCSGIQIQSGKHKGRLVVPANHSYHGKDVNKWEYRCHSLYSDDYGETWQIGQSSTVGASETQIAEAAEDLLIQDIRMQTHQKGVRAVRFSTDGGAKWAPLEHDPSRKDPRCQGSVIRHGDVLISSNPNSAKRENMTVYVSKDRGKSWQEVIALYPGPSAYSDLEVTDDGNLICLFETGLEGPYEGISFALIPLETSRLSQLRKK